MYEAQISKKVKNYFIDLTSDEEVGEALCGDPSRWLRASSCFFSFSNGRNGPKGALTVKVASMVS